MFDLTGFTGSRRLPLIMGIINVSGESFSEGSASAAESGLSRALEKLDAGADLLDIGGESTRPGASEVEPAEEIRRVVPLIVRLKQLRPETVISVDTRHGETARAALEAGAEIINDVSMLRCDPSIAEAVAARGAALILSHSRGTPENMMSPEWCRYPDGTAKTVAAELRAAAKAAMAAGVAEERIILDPGIGFAKTAEQCWEVLADLAEIAPLPKLLVGISRKSFLGALTGEKDPAKRGSETLAVELMLAAAGVGMIRTHDVAALRRGLTAAEKMRSSSGHVVADH